MAPETNLPDISIDIEEAFRWLAGDGATQFHLDPRHIVVAGESAGGYLTLVTGCRVRQKPKALVALYGYGDLIGDWSSRPNPYPRYNLRKISREEAESQTDGTVISDSDERKGDGSLIYIYYRQNGLWPEKVSGFARSTIADKITPFDPIRNVTPDWPPTLLIHGTRGRSLRTIRVDGKEIQAEERSLHLYPDRSRKDGPLYEIQNGTLHYVGSFRENKIVCDPRPRFVVEMLLHHSRVFAR